MAIYKWYILPIGGLYATYHLLGEQETTIDLIGDPYNGLSESPYNWVVFDPLYTLNNLFLFIARLRCGISEPHLP